MLWTQKSVHVVSQLVSGKKLPQERNEVTRNLSRPVSKNKKSMEENVVDNCPSHDPNSV